MEIFRLSDRLCRLRVFWNSPSKFSFYMSMRFCLFSLKKLCCALLRLLKDGECGDIFLSAFTEYIEAVPILTYEFLTELEVSIIGISPMAEFNS